jgi:hypothetical protein
MNYTGFTDFSTKSISNLLVFFKPEFDTFQ